jgi:hypothetical protein
MSVPLGLRNEAPGPHSSSRSEEAISQAAPVVAVLEPTATVRTRTASGGAAEQLSGLGEGEPRLGLAEPLADLQLRYRHDHGCTVRSYASQAARWLAPRPPVLAGAFAPMHAHPGPNEVHDRPQTREAEKAPGDGPDRKEPVGR